MPMPPNPASPLFLREAEIRRGIDLMLLGHAGLMARLDGELAAAGLGRAHHRALYMIARRPGIAVGGLIALLGVTKQALGRTVGELVERGLVTSIAGRDDRRQRLLRLSADGAALEGRLFAALREALTAAYSAAGPGAVGGFWQVLEGLVPPAISARAGL